MDVETIDYQRGFRGRQAGRLTAERFEPRQARAAFLKLTRALPGKKIDDCQPLCGSFQERGVRRQLVTATVTGVPTPWRRIRAALEDEPQGHLSRTQHYCPLDRSVIGPLGDFDFN